MNGFGARLIAIFVLGGIVHVDAAADQWNTDHYTIVAGDFNGDRRADLLLQSVDGTLLNTVVLADGAGRLTQLHQTWGADYLGIDWNANAAEIVTGDFNGDGRTDLLVRSKAGSGSTYLLLANSSGQFTAVHQPWSNGHLGFNWDGSSARVIVGDFNGDRRADIFLQSKFESGSHAVLHVGADGRFSSVAQTFASDYLGLNWSHVYHAIHAGDINGDGRDDLLLQVRQTAIVLPLGDDFTILPLLPKIHNAVLLADPSGSFSTIYQQWDANYLGVDWLAQNTRLILADFDGDGRADIFLQSSSAGGTHRMLRASATGTFTTVNSTFGDGHLGLNWSGAARQLIVADFNGDGRADFFLQSRSSSPSATVLADTAGSPGVLLQTDAEADVGLGTISKTGATAGAFDVSPSGSAAYTMPIVVTPGTNGMQPNLALVYNSQAGNGLLGVGWSLSGFSVIHRCGRTIEQDDIKGGVNYDVNDRLCLDGERLIRIGNTNEYRTQRESLQQVFLTAGTQSAPVSFTVRDKDGLVREYGTTLDSQIEAQGRPTIRIWALKTIRDRNSNTITFGYQKDALNGDYRPTSITYGANTDSLTADHSSVTFTYTGRPDVTPLYEGGSVINVHQRLAKISTATGGDVVREYRLKYSATGTPVRSQLVSVQECGTDGICFAPTTFTWSDKVDVSTNNAWTGAHFGTTICANGSTGFGFCNDGDNHSTIQYADFNGDGKMDLAFRGDTGIQVLLSTGTGFVSGWSTDICANKSSLYGKCNDSNNYNTIRYPDVNGDGKADLVFRADAGIQIFLSTGAGFAPGWSMTLCADEFNEFGGFVFNPCNAGSLNESSIEHHDVDGDGRADLVFRDASGIHVWRSTGSSYVHGWSTSACANGSTAFGVCNDYDNHSTIEHPDFNGDGKADLAFRSDSGIQVFVSTSSSTSISFAHTLSTTICANGSMAFGACNDGDNHSKIQYPDINGDGKADLVFRSDGGMQAFLFTGTTFIHSWSSNICANRSSDYGFCNDGDNYETIQHPDVNGDGKADLVFRSDSGIRIFLSTGTSFSSGWSTSICANGSSAFGFCNDADNHYSIQFPDINGDGRPDLAFRADGGIQVFKSSGLPDLLLTATTGFGSLAQIGYQPLTSDVYVKDTNASHPVMDVQAPMYVVSSVSTNDGIGGFNTARYKYRGLKKHWHADVSLGFRQIEIADPAGLFHRTTYNQDRKAGIDGTVASQETFASLIRVKHVANTWVQAPAPVCGGRRQPQLIKSIEETYELNKTLVTRTTTDQTFDDCGFPTTVAVEFHDGFKKTVTNKYAHDSVNWILGLITDAQVSAEALGQAAQTRLSSFTYKANGLLETETIEPGLPALSLSTSYQYDAFGNRIGKTVSGPDVLSRTDRQAFDVEGRFVTSKTNALEHTTMFAHDPRNGQPTRIVDPNGLMSEFAYDGFGRKILETRPDRTQSRITYDPTDSGYVIRTKSDGAGDHYVFFDTLGRELQTNTQGFGGAWIYRNVRYDALGRVIFRSNPEFNAPSAHGTSYAYYDDPLGRLKSITTPGLGNRTTTTEYNGLTTTVTNPLGQTRIEVKNSQGKTISVTEAVGTPAAGTTTYGYGPLGTLLPGKSSRRARRSESAP